MTKQTAPVAPLSRLFILATVACVAFAVSRAPAQLVHAVSPRFDAMEAPAAYPFPGFGSGFRQQILIASKRLSGLAGKDIRGIWVRRDMGDANALVGGSVDLEVRMSHATSTPSRAHPVFALNAPRGASQFAGRVIVPHSPALGVTPSPWSNVNSVRIDFTTPFRYTGGDVCIDVSARPVVGAEPSFWFIDHESGSYDGGSHAIGKSCSAFADVQGLSHYAHDHWLQVGNTMRLTAFGKPGSSPMMLLGATAVRGGLDLSTIGATGCRQHINYFSVTRLRYPKPPFVGAPSAVHFEIQIPAATSLLGVSVFTQFAADEFALPRAEWTNQAGLTTSNGLELRISSLAPDLDMAIVTSSAVSVAAPMPTRGRVDVNRAPVLRLIY